MTGPPPAHPATDGRQLPLAFAARAALAREDFLVAPCNEAAVAWIDRWPDWGAPALVLIGPPGSGKTHLAHVWQARAGGGAFAVASLGTAAPHEIFGTARGCVVEDADRPGDDEALFHLYAFAEASGRHLLITAREPPSRWRGRLRDLVSRLAAAPTARIGPPDEALIAAVLVKLFADCQLRVPEAAIAYLVARMERSFDAARRLVAAIDAAALAARRDVTLPLVREVLSQQP